MLTPSKVFWAIFGMYVLTMFLPAVLLDVAPSTVYVRHPMPAEVVQTTLLACAVFLLGLALGAMVFRFRTPEIDYRSAAFEAGLARIVALTAFAALYVLVFGPPAPFIASFTLTDQTAIAMARENAVKLNPDLIFVRLYSWGRDMFAPVTFALSVQALRLGKAGRSRAVAILGVIVALYLGLWSGQKATMLNYVLALFIFAARDVRSMVVTAAKGFPALAVIVGVLFWFTLPQLANNPDAIRILFIAVSNRVISAPLQVAEVYVDALDRLNLISPADALPYLNFLWTPGILSLENYVGLRYFSEDPTSSIHANTAAFAYAYVLGGYAGCLLGGVAVMAGLRLALKVVGATASPFLSTAFAAVVSYVLLDLMNGNFVSYLLRIVVLGVLVWGAHALLHRYLSSRQSVSRA